MGLGAFWMYKTLARRWMLLRTCAGLVENDSRVGRPFQGASIRNTQNRTKEFIHEIWTILGDRPALGNRLGRQFRDVSRR
jgi:hypothetical protein